MTAFLTLTKDDFLTISCQGLEHLKIHSYKSQRTLKLYEKTKIDEKEAHLKKSSLSCVTSLLISSFEP